MLTGWIEGVYPPGRRVGRHPTRTASSTTSSPRTCWRPTWCRGSRRTPRSRSTRVRRRCTSTTGCSLDLLQLRDAGIDPAEVDRYLDERRAIPRRRLPAWERRGGGASVVLRRGVRPTARCAPRRGAAWAQLRGRTRPTRPVPGRPRPCTRRRGPAASTPSASTCTTPWPATPPGSRAGVRPAAGRDWSFDRARGTSCPIPRACGPGAPPRPPAPRPAAVGGGERDGARGGRRAPRASGRRLGPAPLPAGASGRGGRCRGRRPPGAVPTSIGRWSTTTSGGPTSRASACSAWIAVSRMCPLDGYGRAGRRRRRGVRPRGPWAGAGDRSVLGTPLERGGDVALAVAGQPAASESGVADSAGPTKSRFSRRQWRMTSTITTTRMRPSRTSYAIPVAFSTRSPTK